MAGTAETFEEQEARIARYLQEEEEQEKLIRSSLLREEDPDEHIDILSDHDDEDHVSDSDHDSASEMDDTDEDPDFHPSDDENSRGIFSRPFVRRFFRSRNRNTIDDVIEDVIEKYCGNDDENDQPQTDLDSNHDELSDPDIIPPSDEEENMQYRQRCQTLRTANQQSTIDDVIEAVALGDFEDEEASQGNNLWRNRYVIGRDQETVWKKNPCVAPNVRTRSVNLVSVLPGPIRAARRAKTPLECFELMLDNTIFDKIVTYTNTYIDMVSANFVRERDGRRTDRTEMRSFVGLLLLAGMLRSGHQNLTDLWARDGFGIEAFYTTMSLKRFCFLLQSIRFDSLFDRPRRRELDKFAAFREVFELFVTNCKQNYTTSSCTTIDEQLVAFRGRCSFRQFMKNKPAKYGIKIFTLTDAKMFYVKDMEVYVGTQPANSPYLQSNKPHDIVIRLASQIEGTGRNITGDNWFSSIPLARELLQKKITYVGTLKKNKKELPPELVSKQTEEHKSIFAFQTDMTVVSYAPKRNRNVVMISTMHHDGQIIEENANKPEIILFYNKTKSGVDVVDEKAGTYSTSRRCRRWPLVLFFRCLDIGGINAQVIHIYNNIEKKPMHRRHFLKEIGMTLIKPQVSNNLNYFTVIFSCC